MLTVYFGLIAAFAIWFALLCELFFTPFLVATLPAFRRALQR